jgi:hypothetical protein
VVYEQLHSVQPFGDPLACETQAGHFDAAFFVNERLAGGACIIIRHEQFSNRAARERQWCKAVSWSTPPLGTATHKPALSMRLWLPNINGPLYVAFSCEVDLLDRISRVCLLEAAQVAIRFPDSVMRTIMLSAFAT